MKLINNPKSDIFEDDLDFDLGFDNKPKHRMYLEGASSVFYIYDEIGPVKDYVDLIHALEIAQPGQDIHIRICSCGGYVETAIAIVHAMSRSQANIITHADATVASAANYIFFSGHQMVISKYAYFMFHTASSGLYGKIHESARSLESIDRLMNEMSKDLLFPMLSEEELEAIRNGNDMYIHCEEMLERVALAVEYYEQLEEEEELAKEAAAKKTKRKPRAKKKAK